MSKIHSNQSNRILIIDGSGLRKINLLVNLIKNQQPDIDKISLYTKDPFLINEREKNDN